MSAGGPLEEYKCLCEFMRHYAMLSYYRLALLFAASGGLITGVSSDAIRSRGAMVVLMLKLCGLMVSLAFTVMDYRAGAHLHRLRDRTNVLAAALQYQPFPVASAWNPFTATGAGRYLHGFIVLLWFASLFLNAHLNG